MIRASIDWQTSALFPLPPSVGDRITVDGWTRTVTAVQWDILPSYVDDVEPRARLIILTNHTPTEGEQS